MSVHVYKDGSFVSGKSVSGTTSAVSTSSVSEEPVHYSSELEPEVHGLKTDSEYRISGEKEEAIDEKEANPKGRVIDLVLPIAILIAISVFALVYVGRCMGEEWVFAASQYDGSLGFIDAFANTDATVGLPWGALVAIIVAIIIFLVLGNI